MSPQVLKLICTTAFQQQNLNITSNYPHSIQPISKGTGGLPEPKVIVAKGLLYLKYFYRGRKKVQTKKVIQCFVHK